jgi:hypothetical protein
MEVKIDGTYRGLGEEPCLGRGKSQLLEIIRAVDATDARVPVTRIAGKIRRLDKILKTHWLDDVLSINGVRRGGCS